MSNTNHIITNDFSNPETKALYVDGYSQNKALHQQMTEDCLQCGGCSCFAPLNADYGICCNRLSPYHLETIIEHFSCEKIVNEGWGTHSFSEDKASLDRLKNYDEVYERLRERDDD